MITWPGTIRLARDEDGQGIGLLFAEAAYPDYGVTWTDAKVGGWWIVGEHEGRIRGAVQVSTAKPYGYIGEIVIHPDERGKNPTGEGRLMAVPGVLGILLYVAAFKLMASAGCQLGIGWVAAPRFRRMLERYGGIALNEDGYTMMAKRLA